MSTLFQFALIFQPLPTKDQVERGETPKAILLGSGIQTVLAKSQQEAQTHAARAIPEEYVDKLDQVTVALRPF